MSSDGSGLRLGVFGGTFDPIHIGHLVAASEARHAFGLDRVLFVPAGRPWQKAGYSAPEDRFLMTSLAVAGNPAFSASRVEIDRPGPAFTAETMSALREFFGDDTSLYFIAGADAVARLGTWQDLDILGQVAEIISVACPGWGETPSAESGWPVIHDLEMPGIDISSSAIRERLRSGRPVDYLVSDEVVRYATERALYATATATAGADAGLPDA